MSLKHSLHIGISYATSPDINTLKGCINDAKILKKYFEGIGYETSIRTDESLQKSFACFTNCLCPVSIEDAIHTTKFGMLLEIKQLVNNATGPIIFTFSGHGSNSMDLNKEESDKLDETIVPSDGAVVGNISDDMLYEIFSHSKYPVFCIFDSCHSGSIIDLPLSYEPLSGKITENNKNIIEQPIICISGSRDDQTASDTQNIEGTVGYCGALTACFVAAVKSMPINFTPKQLVDDIALRLKRNKFSQSCILSMSKPELLLQPLLW